MKKIQRPTVRNMENMTILKGAKVAVCGSVGSGKSLKNIHYL